MTIHIEYFEQIIVSNRIIKGVTLRGNKKKRNMINNMMHNVERATIKI